MKVIHNHCLFWPIINYFSNATEVDKWGTPSCHQPHPSTNNIVRDNRSNWLAQTPTYFRTEAPEHLLHISLYMNASL